MPFVKGESFEDALKGPRSADEILLDYIMDICVIVYDRMVELGIDQRELASRMGKKDSQISRLLSGEANFTLKTLSQLDAALGLDLEMRVGRRSISGTVSDDMPRIDSGDYGRAARSDAMMGTTAAPSVAAVRYGLDWKVAA